MRKYQDELNRFQLNEQQLQELKAGVYQHHDRSCHRLVKPIAGLLIVCLLCVGAVLVFQEKESNRIADTPSFTPKDDKQQIAYEPTHYDFLGGMGGWDTIGILSSDTMDEKGNRYPQVNSLPIYRYEHYIDNTGREYGYPDAYYQKKMTTLKQQLALTGELQKNVAGEYYIEDTTMVAKIQHSAEITITMKQSVDPSILNNSREIFTCAKQYQSYYQKIAGITSPVYHISETTMGNYEVIVTQKSEQPAIHEEGKAMIIFQLAGDENGAHHPQIRINDLDNLTFVKDAPVITQEQAKEILLQGGYYYSYQNTEFTKDDIIGYDMVYPDLGSALTFLPYRIPVYRFYIQKEKGIYLFDVIAITQEALASLEDPLIPWYMDLEKK